MKKSNKSEEASILRENAEKLLKKKSAKAYPQLTESEALKLIHDLEVHQIELEMLNQALNQAKEEAEGAVERYSNLYDFAPTGYFTLSRKGEIIELNLTGAIMLGKERIHLKNSSIGLFVTSDTKPAFNLFLNQVFNCQVKKNCEVALLTNGNLPTFVQMTGIAEENSGNCLVTVVDITDRKKGEEALQNERLLLRTLIDNIPDSIYIKDLAYRKTLVNLAEVRNLGAKSVAEVLGTDDFKFYPKELAEKFLSDDQLVLKTGEPLLNREEYIVDENKQKQWLLSSKLPLRDKNGEIIGLVGICRDITEWKMAMEKLSKSEEFSQHLLQTIPFGMDIIDEDGTILFQTENLKNQFIDKAQGKKCWELYRLNKSQCSCCPLINGISIGETIGFESEGVVGGRIFEIVHTGTTFEGKKAILKIFIDITERIQSDQALIRERNLMNALMNYLPDHIYFKDEESRFIRINKAHAESFGLSVPGEEIGKTDIDFFTEEHARQTYKDEQSIIQSGKPFILEEKETWRDRPDTWVSTIKLPLMNPEGTIIGTFGISRDITERKQAEEALQRERDYADGIIETAQAIVLVMDTEGRIVRFNPYMEEISGYKLTEVQGKDWFTTFLLERDRERSHNLFLNAINDIKTRGNVNTIIVKNGDEREIEWYDKTLKDVQGNIVGLLSIGQDITNRKRAEQELFKAKVKAEESDRLKSAFLANMSHEIRTPMNGILGFAELLKEPDLTGEEQKKYIDIIEKSGERMLNIINNIICISKVESKQVEVIISETNMNEMLDFISDFFKIEIEQKGLQIIINKKLPTKRALVKTDKEKVYAILTNLTKNAIKFTSQGYVEIGCVRKGTYVEFFVKDTGVGIRQDQKEVIFERFRQGSELLTRNYEGAGLGLSISKAYVEMLDGTIRVESEIGKGSIFYFTIPNN